MGDDVIRYRLRWHQVLWKARAVVLLIALLFAELSSGWDALGVVSAAFIAFCALVLVASQRHFGVDLRPDALVLRGYTRRVIPWTQIGGIHASTYRNTRRVDIDVPADGRSWPLRAPEHLPVLGPDRAFDAKLRTIVRAWEERRGAEWTPPHLAEGGDLRQWTG